MELTQAYLKTILHYDPETGYFKWLTPSRSAFKSRNGWLIAVARRDGKRVKTQNQKGYIKVVFGGKTYLAHRLAVTYVYGTNIDGLCVDHINGDKKDNRIANLRVCDHAGNMKNQRKTCGYSAFKGVTVTPDGKRIRSSIQSDGKTYRLGSFEDEVSAALAYDRMAIKLHGEFACTNKSLGLL